MDAVADQSVRECRGCGELREDRCANPLVEHEAVVPTPSNVDAHPSQLKEPLRLLLERGTLWESHDTIIEHRH